MLDSDGDGVGLGDAEIDGDGDGDRDGDKRGSGFAAPSARRESLTITSLRLRAELDSVFSDFLS